MKRLGGEEDDPPDWIATAVGVVVFLAIGSASFFGSGDGPWAWIFAAAVGLGAWSIVSACRFFRDERRGPDEHDGT
jgi:peptidoglycan/LPS O-acetylase OafA/YrhL